MNANAVIGFWKQHHTKILLCIASIFGLLDACIHSSFQTATAVVGIAIPIVAAAYDNRIISSSDNFPAQRRTTLASTVTELRREHRVIDVSYEY